MRQYAIGFIFGAALCIAATAMSGGDCSLSQAPTCDAFDTIYPKKNKDKFQLLSERDTCLLLRIQQLEAAVCEMKNRLDGCCPEQ